VHKIFLASDNTSPAHPAILSYLLQVNEHHAPSYGLDFWTEKSSERIAEIFQRPCKVIFVPTGTGANVLSLKLMLKAHHSVLCSDIAHIAKSETGAAEAIVGCKLLQVKSHHGKITPEDALDTLNDERHSGKHGTLPTTLSITQSTEVGTIYHLEQLKALRNFCKEENLLLHIDACRIYNAAVSCNTDLKQMIDAAEPDIISLGGTKNGLLQAEAVVIFNRALYEGADHLQKQTLQLLSKMRYLSAQYIPFFENDLWKSLAAHANKQALHLATFLQSIPKVKINHPVETNQIFFSVPPSWIPLIQEKIACFVWNKPLNELRFITSWNTSDQEIEAACSVFSKL
jgi:threonine aldolase